MSALLTHAALGLLLGVAVRLPLRHLPIAVALSILPDLDHLGEYTAIPFGESRITLHNVAFCIALPLAVYLALTWRGAKPETRQLAAAAPLLLGGHLLLDLLPLDPLGAGGWAAVWYPFTDTIYTFHYAEIKARDPTTYSTVTLLLVLLATLALAAVLAHRLGHAPERHSRQRALGVAGAYAAAWLLLFPGIAMAGALEPKPEHANGAYTLRDAQVDLPWGRFTTTVYHHGGNAAGSGGLRLELWGDDALLANVTNTDKVGPGQRWNLDLGLPIDVRTVGKLEARLVSPKDGYEYERAPVKVTKGHVDVPITLLGVQKGAGQWVVSLRNDGDERVPGGALVVRVTMGPRIVDEQVVPDALAPRGVAGVVLAAPDLAGVPLSEAPFVEVKGADDGFSYLRRSVAG